MIIYNPIKVLEDENAMKAIIKIKMIVIDLNDLILKDQFVPDDLIKLIPSFNTKELKSFYLKLVSFEIEGYPI